MSPSNRSADLRNSYLVALGLHGEDKADLRREALRVAHDLRKFEIELLWKRSTYLWGFQIVCFAGLAAVLSRFFDFFNSSVGIEQTLILFGVCFSISIFGLVSSFLWYATADASRVWFYSWEKHIDFLEIEFTGDLYKSIYTRSSGPIYSLTEINKTVTKIAFIFWSIILFIMYFAIVVKFNLSQATMIIALMGFLYLFYLGWRYVGRLVESRGPSKMLPIESLNLKEGKMLQRFIDWPI